MVMGGRNPRVVPQQARVQGFATFSMAKKIWKVFIEIIL
jgi:hypothetical protein